MNTAFLLMAQYDGRAIIPADLVCRDYFPHLTPDTFARKVALGEIALPMTRMDDSKKSARGVHLQDLAAYIDKRAEMARKECRQLQS